MKNFLFIVSMLFVYSQSTNASNIEEMKIGSEYDQIENKNFIKPSFLDKIETEVNEILLKAKESITNKDMKNYKKFLGMATYLRDYYSFSVGNGMYKIRDFSTERDDLSKIVYKTLDESINKFKIEHEK